jgi:hypothetical protein
MWCRSGILYLINTALSRVARPSLLRAIPFSGLVISPKTAETVGLFQEDFNEASDTDAPTI